MNNTIKRRIRAKKIGRNDLCPCGSGKKYKKCCMRNDKNDKMEKKTSEDISKHLLPDPFYLNHPDNFNTEDEIINFYKSVGYIVDVDVWEDEDEGVSNLEVSLICYHGYSAHSQYFQLIDGKWKSDSCGTSICPMCYSIRENEFIVCSSCGDSILPNTLPTLSESERLFYYRDRIDYLSNVQCQKCGSKDLSFVDTEFEPDFKSDIWDQLKRADDEAMAWIDEFRTATPERQREMSDIEAFEQDREYDLINCSSYEQFKRCKEARERPEPECKDCEQNKSRL